MLKNIYLVTKNIINKGTHSITCIIFRTHSISYYDELIKLKDGHTEKITEDNLLRRTIARLSRNFYFRSLIVF